MNGSIKTISLALLMGSMLFLTGCTQNKKQEKMETPDNQSLFPKGNKLPKEWFSGNAFLYPLLARNENNEYAIGSVTFEPGARTHWHTHPKGQVLIITDGEGIYQEKGKAAQFIKKGNVISIPENVEHWHGAKAQNQMIHIAITNYQDETNVVWLNPVTDEEYNQAQNK
ncbi:MAG TPA: cupin domain-containing protein [Prolixibacteraceae bacterium]|nr:cupin domain-containing protein [Prolixibacteraceae bacterium]